MIRRFALAALLALTACVAALPLPARAQTFLESTTPPLETKTERPLPPNQASRNFVLGRDLNIVNAALVELRDAVKAGGGGGGGPVATVAPKTWIFTGDGVATTVALAGAVVSSTESYVVTLDGVVQAPTTDYAVNASTDQITFATAPPDGSAGVVRLLGYVQATSPGVLSVTDFGATGDGTTDNAAAFAVLAAVANSASANPTVYLPPGEYRYTGGLVFTRPVTVRCEPGAVLNYTGTGKALTFGPPGLTIANYHKEPYIAEGCGWVGGTAMTHGIYVNPYVTKVRVLGGFMHSFGNPSAWGVFTTHNNWDVEVAGVDYQQGGDTTQRNFVKIVGYDGATPDYGNSRLRFHDNHVIGHEGIPWFSVWTQGKNSDISRSTIAGGVVRLGRWAVNTVISEINGEFVTNTLAKSLIEFGDPDDGDPTRLPDEPIDGITIAHLDVNLHHFDLSGDGYVLAPTSARSKLTNALLLDVKAFSTLPEAPLVKLNDLTNQHGNRAYANKNVVDGYRVVLHTAGANILPWSGDQEILFVDSARDVQTLHQFYAGRATNQVNGFQFLGPQGLQATIDGWGVGGLDISAGVSGTGLMQLMAALGVKVSHGLALNTSATARPVCDSTRAGMLWYTPGAPGVKDAADVCAKNEFDAWFWRSFGAFGALGLRATATVDLGNIATNACTHTNVSVAGAVLGGECSTGLPSGFPDQTFATCHVDEPDVVDLHVCNLGPGYDPPSSTYSVRVFNP